MKLEFLRHYFKNKHKIYNYFLYRLNFDRSQAEDLTSETFLRAYKKFESFDEEKASFRTWIFTIAHNLLVNFYRDKKETLSLEETDLAGIKVADEAYLNKLINQLEIKLIVDKIMALPENYSQVLILRLVNQLSFSEISQIVNKEEGNVRVLFSRGMNKLSEKI